MSAAGTLQRGTHGGFVGTAPARADMLVGAQQIAGARSRIQALPISQHFHRYTS